MKFFGFLFDFRLSLLFPDSELLLYAGFQRIQHHSLVLRSRRDARFVRVDDRVELAVQATRLMFLHVFLANRNCASGTSDDCVSPAVVADCTTVRVALETTAAVLPRGDAETADRQFEVRTARRAGNISHGVSL